ncbi:MAG TPA: hypothetical protein VGM51_12945 [Armatimonadota bacterium]|jgi:WD40 repeat protein
MDLFAYDVPPGRERQLTFPTQPKRLIGNLVFDSLAISSDGKRAAIVANPPDRPAAIDDLIGANAPGYHVWVVDLTNRRIRQVSRFVPIPPDPELPDLPKYNETSYQHVAWSPDCRYITAWQTIGIALPPGPETSSQPKALGDEVWKVWNAATGRDATASAVVAQKDEWVSYAARSPDGTLVATVSPQDEAAGSVPYASVTIRNVSTNRITRTVKLPGTSFRSSVHWTPEGRYVVVVTQQMRDSQNAVHVRSIMVKDGRVTHDWWDSGSLGRVGFSRSGRWLVVLCGTDLTLWDWKTGKKRYVRGPSGPRILGVDWAELPAKR